MSDRVRLNFGQAEDCFRQLKFDEASRFYSQALLVASSLVSIRAPQLPGTCLSFAEVYRKFGLSQMFVEKWRKGDDDVFEIAVGAFLKSLSWSLKGGQFHQENVLMIATIFSNEFSFSGDRSYSPRKVQLAERIVDTLIAMLRSSTSSSAESKRRKLLEMRFSFIRRVVTFATFAVASKDVARSSSLLEGISQSLEFLKSEVAQLNDSDFARALHPGIADVEQEAKKLKAIEQGLVLFCLSKKYFSAAMENTSKREDNLFQALDRLQQAEKLVRQKHVEFHCQILAEMGLVHFELNDLNRAKQELDEALTIAARLDFAAGAEWRNAARQTLAKIRKLETDQARESKELEEAIGDVRCQIEFGLDHFVSYVVDNYPPVHFGSFRADAWSDRFVVVNRKVLLKVIQMYHTDKVDRLKFGQTYFRIAEEILKHLNASFNKMKK